MSRILLIGGNFKNKGAEAMALTALAELHARYPGAELVLASYAKRENLAYGPHPLSGAKGVSWRLIPNTRSPLKALWLLLAILLPGPRQRWALDRDLYLQVLAGSDLVVDISGYALTSQRPPLRQLVYAFEVLSAGLLRVPFVAMTQAMGPFDGWLSPALGRFCLRRIALLNIRGSRSEALVRTLEPNLGERLQRCADSAYLFPATAAEQARPLLPAPEPGVPRIGLVPNINIYQRSKPLGPDSPYLGALVALCDQITEALGGEVAFVCHEAYEGRQDDAWILDQVLPHCRHPERIHRVEADHPAALLKAVLGELDFLVASRFHSLVAAISMGVPFLGVGWSHKYQELVEEAGVADSVCDGRNLAAADLLRHFDAAWGARDANRARLKAVGPQLKASARAAYDRMRERWPLEA
jgi:colanic acid/amylovoran biosynthesis protein